MPLEFGRISADQLRDLPKEKTVFFFPVGPLEDHGPHLPMGLDTIEAEHLCCIAAEKLERDLPGWIGVVMPTAPLGVTSNTTEVAIVVRGHVLRDWLVDACRSLMRPGFRHFVCFSGNLGPRQLTAIEEAGKSISRRGPITAIFSRRGSIRPSLVCVQSGMITPRQVSQAPLWPDAAEHGARRDTSVGMALGVLTVADTNQLSTLAARPRKKSALNRLIARFRRQTTGFWGNSSPADGQAAAGQALMRTTVDEIFPKLRAVWEGANPNFLFRSYYSVLPPNQSFFKAWLLVVMIGAILIAWIYMGMNDFFMPH